VGGLLRSHRPQPLLLLPVPLALPLRALAVLPLTLGLPLPPHLVPVLLLALAPGVLGPLGLLGEGGGQLW